MSTPEQRQLRRNSILRTLGTVHPVAIGPRALLDSLEVDGHRIDQATLEGDLVYLQDKGLLQIENAGLSVAAKRYRLTADGMEYCEREYLK